MNHDNSQSDQKVEERLKNLINRIPDKEEFIAELETYVDDIESYEGEDSETLVRKKTFFFFSLFLIILMAVFSLRPVSLNKLIKLHEKDSVTLKIMEKYMYSKPHGEALKPLQAMADTGNMHAQNMVCWVHLTGINVEKDPAFGAKYCHKSAAQGHSGAQANLGLYYYKRADKPDIEKAIHYYRQSAAERPRSAWNLSDIYENASSHIQDYELAVHYKTMAANNGHARAMYSLGGDYRDGRLGLEISTEMSLQYLHMAKKAGHRHSDGSLALTYRYAEPPHQDYQKMIFHANQAIRKTDHALGYTMLAEAYLEGLGVQKNKTIAFRYYDQAAKRGDQYAIGKLESLLPADSSEGFGFEYDGVILPHTVRNFINNPSNFLNVRKMVWDESLPPTTVTKIFEYYAANMVGDVRYGKVPLEYLQMFYAFSGYKAEFEPIIKACEYLASIGSGQHAYQLGIFYMSGHGVERSPKKSIDWISKAMEMGHPDVNDYVGFYLRPEEDLYGDGGHTERKLLEKAAVMGSEAAAMRLGKIYDQGIGVKANKIAAMYWWSHADSGLSDFGDDIVKLRKTMNPEDILKAKSLIKDCSKSKFKSCLENL